MRLLLDTNVLLDVAVARRPDALAAQALLRLCSGPDAPHDGLLAWHTLPTVFYVCERQDLAETAWRVVRAAIAALLVIACGQHEAERALDLGFVDFEDALQAAAAEAAHADFIVTRNTGDFLLSPVPAISPAEFLQRWPVADSL